MCRRQEFVCGYSLFGAAAALRCSYVRVLGSLGDHSSRCAADRVVGAAAGCFMQ